MPNIWTVKEFADRWKVTDALIYKCIKEGMPVECAQPVRLGDPAEEWFKNRGKEQKEG